MTRERAMEMFKQLKTCPVEAVELETPEGCVFIKVCPNGHGLFQLGVYDGAWHIKFS